MLMQKVRYKKPRELLRIGLNTVVVLTAMVSQSSYATAYIDESKKQCVVDLGLATKVNNWVNNNVIFKSDQESHGVADYWQTLRETLKLRTGDCEDYAIAKWSLLQQYGVPQNQLQLWYGYYHTTPHMVVIYCGTVLDSNTNEVLTVDQSDFQPRFRIDNTNINLWQHLQHRTK